MENRRIQTYGRKKARGLSQTQNKALEVGLEKYKVIVPHNNINLLDIFAPQNYKKLIFEIGFGHGEHLIEMAKMHSKCAFIGCEPFENGVARAAIKVQEHSLDNIKIYMGDSRILLDQVLPNSIDEFDIMFPDPWPKKRHIKRRLISLEFLEKMILLLTANGIIKLASDCEHYINFVLENVALFNEKYNGLLSISCGNLEGLSNKPENWGSTRYEQKALSKGKRCYYLTISKKGN